jgi:hypothetical protein
LGGWGSASGGWGDPPTYRPALAPAAAASVPPRLVGAQFDASCVDALVGTLA